LTFCPDYGTYYYRLEGIEMSKTKEYLDQYLATRPEKTSNKIRSM